MLLKCWWCCVYLCFVYVYLFLHAITQFAIRLCCSLFCDPFYTLCMRVRYAIVRRLKTAIFIGFFLAAVASCVAVVVDIVHFHLHAALISLSALHMLNDMRLQFHIVILFCVMMTKCIGRIKLCQRCEFAKKIEQEEAGENAENESSVLEWCRARFL